MDKEEKAFDEWMAKVDVICLDKIGLSVYDLDDYNWAGCFEIELTPREAFNEYYEWIFDETWEETNGQSGVGA